MGKAGAKGKRTYGKDSISKRLGVKLSNGQVAKAGAVIVRQRGTNFIPGKNVGIGKDYTLFAKKSGIVKFKKKTKIGFNGQRKTVTLVEID